MLPLNGLNIPLKNILIHIFNHVTDYLFTCLHAKKYYKIKNMYGLLICKFHMEICCYKRYP